MSFLHYSRKRVVDPNPCITLTPNGEFRLNAQAIRQCVNGASHVQLYFDPDKRLVGLSFQNGKSDLYAYKLTKTLRRKEHRAKKHIIHCRRFFVDHDIPLRALRRPLTWDGKAKLWTFKVAAIA